MVSLLGLVGGAVDRLVNGAKGQPAAPALRLREFERVGLGFTAHFSAQDLRGADEQWKAYRHQAEADMAIAAQDAARGEEFWEWRRLVGQLDGVGRRRGEVAEQITRIEDGIRRQIAGDIALGVPPRFLPVEAERSALREEDSQLARRQAMLEEMIGKARAAAVARVEAAAEGHRKRWVAELLVERERLRAELCAAVAGPAWALIMAERTYSYLSGNGNAASMLAQSALKEALAREANPPAAD